MMKSIISAIAFTLLFLGASAQVEKLQMPVDAQSGMITYQEVVNVAGTKDELFNRCSTWLHTFYANPWEATKVRDQSTGLIKVQHQFRVYDYGKDSLKQDAGMIIYNLKLEFKQDKYRYTIDNLTLKALSAYPIENWLDKSRPDYSEHYQTYLNQIDHYFRDELIPSLKAGMLPPKEVIEDKW